MKLMILNSRSEEYWPINVYNIPNNNYYMESPSPKIIFSHSISSEVSIDQGKNFKFYNDLQRKLVIYEQ